MGSHASAENFTSAFYIIPNKEAMEFFVVNVIANVSKRMVTVLILKYNTFILFVKGVICSGVFVCCIRRDI